MSGKSIVLSESLAEKLLVASKRLGVDLETLVNRILGDWVRSNKKLVVSFEDILSEYEASLSGYSDKTRKTKIRIVRGFVEWCSANGVEPSDEVLEKYISDVSSRYSQSYIQHARSAIKDFVSWYKERF